MSATTTTRHTATRRTHVCSLCATLVHLGQTYDRWRYFSEDGASTVIVHPDCFSLWLQIRDRSFENEWEDGGLRWEVEDIGEAALQPFIPAASDPKVAAVWQQWASAA